MNVATITIALILILTLSQPGSANLLGAPIGAPVGSTAFLPGENVDDASGAPTVPGPLIPVGDITKPKTPNVVFYSFGTINNARREPITHVFVLRNSGKAPIVIAKSRSGCGCTTASINGLTQDAGLIVERGSIFAVHVSIDTTQLYVGTINKIVWIYLAGQNSPAFTMHVIGHVTPIATFDPSSIDIGNTRIGEAKQWKLTVVTDTSVYGAHPCDPLDVSGTLNVARDSVPAKLSGDLLSRTYSVTISPRAREGMFSDTIIIPSDAKSGSLTPSLLVTGSIAGDVTATPSSVQFGTLMRGTSAACKITLSGTPRSLAGLAATCRDSAVQIKIVRVNDKMSVLHVVITPTKVGNLQSSVSVATSDGQHLEIPIFAWIGGKT